MLQSTKMLETTRTLRMLYPSKLAIRAPPPPTAHDGLTYDRANSFALQAMTACGAYRRVVVSYQQYEYNDNLSEGLPVINNTSAKMTYVVVLSINALMTCMVADLDDL